MELNRAMKNQQEWVAKGSEKPLLLSCSSLSGQHYLWSVHIVLKLLYRTCYLCPGLSTVDGRDGKVLTDKGGSSHFPCLSPEPWLPLRLLFSLCVLERRARKDYWIHIKWLLFLFLAVCSVLPSSDESFQGCAFLPGFPCSVGCPVGCKRWISLGKW